MTVYILGGGPTALAVAHGLALSGRDRFVLLERNASLGGLAQTLDWYGVGAHDLGPHKIFTIDPDLNRRIEALLPAADWLTRVKRSSIFMHGHYLPYPPSPFSLARVFGYATFARMLASYAKARSRALGGTPPPETFEQDLHGRIGPVLYEALFKPIALKLWGDPAMLDAKLSQGRVQTPKLSEVVGRLLGTKKTSEFEALTFRYPRGGLRRLWDAIRTQSAASGTFMLSQRVESLESERGRITSIRYVDAASGRPGEIRVDDGDFVASTLPFRALFKLAPGLFPAELVARSEQVLVLNDLVLVFLHVDVGSLLEPSWVFVPDPKIAFHRVSEQESFDPGMVPKGSIVCCEIMSHAGRPLAGKGDDELVRLAVDGLHAMGFGGFKVLDRKVIRLPSSYPVFRPGYVGVLKDLLASADSIPNARTIGRQGAFNYIGTLDSMDIGYGFARWLENPTRDAWQAERARTSHYPVLD